jgi:methylmalonyl-CoA mutase
LKSGLIQTAIGKVSASKKKNADIRKDVKVGTNMYANLTEEVLENRDNDVRRQVQARILEIEDFKSDRDPSIKDALKSIELDPKCSCSIDKLTELWKNGATISEISRIVYPIEETITIPVFNQKRAVQHFEELRAAVEAMKPSPEVFFANMGPIAQHKARADFSRGFFEVAGLKIINSDGLACENCFAREYKEKKSPIVVICSTDETYPELVPAITAKAKGINPEVKIVVAGYPKEYIESFTACGVNEFIHIKADAYEVLKRLVESVGGAV